MWIVMVNLSGVISQPRVFEKCLEIQVIEICQVIKMRWNVPSCGKIGEQDSKAGEMNVQ
jgi:hypothetical protein